MSKIIKLKRGLDIKLEGEIKQTMALEVASDYYALKPTDFRALTPKLEVRPGDRVKAGDPLFSNKYSPKVKFTSPVSGVVDRVNRGERRRILEVVVKADEAIEYKTFHPGKIEESAKEKLVDALLESGLWPLIKQRPYDIIANPASTPKAIIVSGFDSAPLAPDFSLLLKEETAALQTGFDCLKALSPGPVYLNLRPDTPSSSPLANLKGVEINYFSGPHPAGNTGIQLHHLDPVNKGEIVWSIHVMDIVLIGRFFLTGRYDVRKTIALVGSEVKEPAYYHTIAGARVGCLVEGRVKNELHERVISGNVLTGKRVDTDSFLGYYNYMVTVIPEGDYSEFLGWASPGFNKFSMSKSFPSFLCPKKKYPLDCNYHGERRAYVVSGQYEKVLPMDMFPVYLIKAILAHDLDKMEQLGMYEVAPEDMALCEFVCTSKIPVQQVLEQGIEFMMKELM